MRTTIKQFLRFLLLLLGIQVIRGLLIWGMWILWHPASDSLAWVTMDIVAYSLVGLGLFIIFRPTAIQLSLSLRNASRLERTITLVAGIFVLLFFASSLLIDPVLLLINFQTVIIIPVFEELLFRGWGWKQLEQGNSFKYAGIIHWLMITLAFGIWHFGYMDIYILKVAPAWPEMQWDTFFLMKFLTTFAIGLVVGLPRLRTGRVYGSIFLHALINLFGK